MHTYTGKKNLKPSILQQYQTRVQSYYWIQSIVEQTKHMNCVQQCPQLANINP